MASEAFKSFALKSLSIVADGDRIDLQSVRVSTRDLLAEHSQDSQMTRPGVPWDDRQNKIKCIRLALVLATGAWIKAAIDVNSGDR